MEILGWISVASGNLSECMPDVAINLTLLVKLGSPHLKEQFAILTLRYRLSNIFQTFHKVQIEATNRQKQKRKC